MIPTIAQGDPVYRGPDRALDHRIGISLAGHSQ